jgi:hypothetical protein
MPPITNTLADSTRGSKKTYWSCGSSVKSQKINEKTIDPGFAPQPWQTFFYGFIVYFSLLCHTVNSLLLIFSKLIQTDYIYELQFIQYWLANNYLPLMFLLLYSLFYSLLYLFSAILSRISPGKLYKRSLRELLTWNQVKPVHVFV